MNFAFLFCFSFVSAFSEAKCCETYQKSMTLKFYMPNFIKHGIMMSSSRNFLEITGTLQEILVNSKKMREENDKPECSCRIQLGNDGRPRTGFYGCIIKRTEHTHACAML